MSRYLLSCTCGKSVPVELRQAGEKVPCACGATLDVPPLRELRRLPAAMTTDAVATASSRWGVRQGAITASLIVAILLAIASALSWYTEPTLPRFDPAARTRIVEENLARLTAVAGWRLWVDAYLPLSRTGLREYEYPEADAIRQQIARHRFNEATMLIGAGIFVGMAAIVAVWRSG